MNQPATATLATYPHLTINADGVPLIAGTTMKVVELVTAHRKAGELAAYRIDRQLELAVFLCNQCQYMVQ
jgi:hypothetical protein